MLTPMAALSSEIPCVGPEGKYLLVVLMHDKQWELEPVHTAKYLRWLTGMTSAAVVKGREQLVEHGYLASTAILTGNKGRPRERLELPASHLEKGSRVAPPPKRTKKKHSNKQSGQKRKRRDLPFPYSMDHQPLIESLLMQDSEARLPRSVKGMKSPRQGKHPIGPTSRLLLCVLLRFADRCGTVRSLGISDISRLTGMTEDQVKYHVGLLKNARYIRTVISGLTNGKLFIEAKGAYFLNLKHDSFGQYAYSGKTFILNKEQLMEEYDAKAIQLYHEATLWARRKAGKQDSFPCRLSYPLTSSRLLPIVQDWLQQGFEASHDYFTFDNNNAPRHRQQAYVELVIDGIASGMLSDGFQMLGEIYATINKESEPRVGGMREFLGKYTTAIKRDLFAVTIARYYTDAIPPDIDKKLDGAADLLAITALDTALLAYGCIKACVDKLDPLTRYRILSQPEIRTTKEVKLLAIEEFCADKTNKIFPVICVSHSFTGQGLPRYEKTNEFISESIIEQKKQLSWGLISSLPTF